MPRSNSSPRAGASDRDRNLRLRGVCATSLRPDAAARAGDDRGGAGRLAHAFDPAPPRIDLGAVLGPCRPPARQPPRRSQHQPAPAAPVRRRRRGRWTFRSSCSSSSAMTQACSSPSTTAGRSCSPRTRSSRRPRPGLASAAWTPRHRRIDHRQDRLGVRRDPPLGENFIGRQAWDIGRVFDPRRPGGFPGTPVGLYARGEALASRPRTRSPGRPTPEGTPAMLLLRDGS